MIAPTQPLHEQYRPGNWSEVVGQEKAVTRIEALRRRGLGGRAYWISGQSGTGKTTIGKLIAEEVAEELCIHEYDAGLLNLSEISRIETASRTIGMGEEKRGRAYLINEAHGLSQRVIRQLLVMLERIPPHVVWVFTTTLEGESLLFENHEDVNPLLSRCVRLQLTRSGLAEAFGQRLLDIGRSEELIPEDMTLKQAMALLKKHRNNFRAALTDLECGSLL